MSKWFYRKHLDTMSKTGYVFKAYNPDGHFKHWFSDECSANDFCNWMQEIEDKENKKMNTQDFKSGDVVLWHDKKFFFVGEHPIISSKCILMDDLGNLATAFYNNVKHKPKIVTKEFWVNIYPDGVVNGGNVYLTELLAKQYVGKNCIRQQKFTYEVEE